MMISTKMFLQIGLVTSLLYIVLGIVTLDPLTGLGSNIMGG